jgi:DNA polymerase-3 subunit epsilon
LEIIKDLEFAILDFETTGTSAKYNRVIEVGVVKLKNKKIIDKYQTFIDPGTEIPPYITDITGITDADIIGAPSFEDIIPSLLQFIGDSILTAHNLPFDLSFLTTELSRAGYESIQNQKLCTLKLARRLYPELKSKSLGNLVKHFHFRNSSAHRALGDATATAKVLVKMIEKLEVEDKLNSLSDLLEIQQANSSSKGFRVIKKSLQSNFSKLTESPGVYLFKDKNNKIIYVGKAKSLKRRVGDYFSNSAPSKTKRIVRSASNLEHIKTNTELSALILEAELVKKYKPRLNSQLKKYSPSYFVKFDLSKKFPIPKVSSIFDYDGNDYFGPYNRGDDARSMIDILHKTFALRECTEKEFKKKQKCYLHDIDRCIAPCIYPSEDDYKLELEKVYEFLEGKNQNAVDVLLQKMKRFAEERHYEQAALIRDTVNLILNQLHKTLILAEPINKAHVLVKIKGSLKDDIILLVEGKVLIKEYALDSPNNFEEALQDYYSGTIRLFKDPDKKDLERLKFSLNWFLQHRNRLAVFYLRHFESYDKLQSAVG